jgi:hypothetical protein
MTPLSCGGIGAASSGSLRARSASEFGIVAGCHDGFGASDIVLDELSVARGAVAEAPLRYEKEEKS